MEKLDGCKAVFGSGNGVAEKIAKSYRLLPERCTHEGVA